jgi:dihydrofolate synthase/folylpolyglutamate synthase
MNNIKEYLSKKDSEYKKIDTKRIFKTFNKIKNHFNLQNVIHVVGTNGKGSSCTFLSEYLAYKKYKVGLYTSPHILELNERIKIDNIPLNFNIINKYHNELLSILKPEDSQELSYFEYMTILAGFIFNKEKCNFCIFEAGLGGEFDATNIFKKDISLITKIGIDHKEFLGGNISQIALTKLKSIDKKAVIGLQDEDIVYTIANSLSKELILTKENINQDINKLNLPQFLKDNLQSVNLVLKFFNIQIDNLKFFDNFKIFGRFYEYEKNIFIDVGHNELSAKAIKKELKDEKIHLIFNTYKDKEYKNTLEILKNNILKVYILEVINNNRIENIETLKNILEELNISYETFNKIDNDKKYLVYGSFSVVEKFLKEFN